jgi:protein FRG1
MDHGNDEGQSSSVYHIAMSEVVSKKLKFKGDKPKKKKRSHKETEGAGDGIDNLAALAAADPRGKS